MRNPSALTDEVLDKIESLLSGYNTALDNILYHHFNTTQDQKDIREALDAIAYARRGPTDEELVRDFAEYGGD